MEGPTGGLEPAPPPAKVTTASKNQQRDDYDQKKCRRVHEALLRTREPSRVRFMQCVGRSRRCAQARNLLNLCVNTAGPTGPS